MNKIRGPNETDRTVIIGDTGSGKSQFACALLSTRDFDVRPWFIIDYKGEDLVEEILEECPSIIVAPVDKDPPKKPGLYYTKVRPLVDDVPIEIFLRKIYDRASNGNKRLGSGIFLDEGYALPKNSKFFDVILTQGRSLKIPVICLYQRPVHMSRFAISQSTFRCVLGIQDERDKETASKFIKPVTLSDGTKITVFDDLPRYHALWYDVARSESHILRPAPSRDAIIQTFKRRLNTPKQRALI